MGRNDEEERAYYRKGLKIQPYNNILFEETKTTSQTKTILQKKKPFLNLKKRH